MARKRGRYIHLSDGTHRLPDLARIKFIPQSRTVMGPDRGWGGIIIQPDGVQKRIPTRKFTLILQTLFFGLSFLLGIFGINKILGRNKEFNQGVTI